MKNLKEFILEEYKNATQLTYHIDSLRNKVVSFYLSFASIITAVIFLGMDKDVKDKEFNMDISIALICFFVLSIGILAILICAKLRKVQIEHFAIINNIRSYQLSEEDNAEKRNNISEALVLNDETLLNARAFSGTHYFVLLIILSSSVICGLGLYYLAINLILVLILSALAFLIMNWLYLSQAKYKNENIIGLQKKTQ